MKNSCKICLNYDLGKTIINHAIKNEVYNGVNPFYGLEPLSVDNERIRYLNIEEIKRLKSAIKSNDMLYLFVYIALTTGARLESILHLQKKDVDFAIGGLNIKDLKNKCHYMGALTDEVRGLVRGLEIATTKMIFFTLEFMKCKRGAFL